MADEQLTHFWILNSLSYCIEAHEEQSLQIIKGTFMFFVLQHLRNRDEKVSALKVQLMMLLFFNILLLTNKDSNLLKDDQLFNISFHSLIWEVSHIPYEEQGLCGLCIDPL